MVDVAAKRSEVSAGSFGAAGRTRAGGPPGPSARVLEERELEASTVGERATCGWCGRRVPRHGEQYAVLWDSSAHPSHRGGDGRAATGRRLWGRARGGAG